MQAPDLIRHSASYPTTAHGADEPLNTVILPAWPPAGQPPNVRFVLGPAVSTATSVQGVEVLNQSGQWMVNATLTPSGAASWDALASTHFHTFLGGGGEWACGFLCDYGTRPIILHVLWETGGDLRWIQRGSGQGTRGPDLALGAPERRLWVRYRWLSACRPRTATLRILSEPRGQF